MLPIAATGNPFDLFAGLPLHPLAVHLPLVLLPLGALGLLLMLVVPRWRTQLAWPVVGMIGLAAAGALVAKLSGEALARRVGSPGEHEELGNWLLGTAALLFAATLGWWMWQRKQATVRRPTGVVGLILGTLLAALAIGAIIVTVLTGHSGATAAWGDRIAIETPESTSPQPVASSTGPTAAPTAAPTAGQDISIGTVAQHDDAASCWVAIEGTVYDVTEWIPEHPGGPERILGICGTDATEDFGEQHAGQALPTEQLSQFAIGELAER